MLGVGGGGDIYMLGGRERLLSDISSIRLGKLRDSGRILNHYK